MLGGTPRVNCVLCPSAAAPNWILCASVTVVELQGTARWNSHTGETLKCQTELIGTKLQTFLV